jgi:hypothetical protein
MTGLLYLLQLAVVGWSLIVVPEVIMVEWLQMNKVYTIRHPNNMSKHDVWFLRGKGCQEHHGADQEKPEVCTVLYVQRFSRFTKL